MIQAFWNRLKLPRKIKSCVTNTGTTAPYLNLETGARQGDLICAYCLILVLETLFCMIKTNQNVEGLDICDYSFIFTWRRWSHFHLKNAKSVMELLYTIYYFLNIFKLLMLVHWKGSVCDLCFKSCWIDIRYSGNIRGLIVI